MQQVCPLCHVPLSAFLDRILSYYAMYQYISTGRAAMLFIQYGGSLLYCVPSSAFSIMFKLLCFMQSNILGQATIPKAVYYKEMINC